MPRCPAALEAVVPALAIRLQRSQYHIRHINRLLFLPISYYSDLLVIVCHYLVLTGILTRDDERAVSGARELRGGARMQSRLTEILIRRAVGVLVTAIAARAAGSAG